MPVRLGCVIASTIYISGFLFLVLAAFGFGWKESLVIAGCVGGMFILIILLSVLLIKPLSFATLAVDGYKMAYELKCKKQGELNVHRSKQGSCGHFYATETRCDESDSSGDLLTIDDEQALPAVVGFSWDERTIKVRMSKRVVDCDNSYVTEIHYFGKFDTVVDNTRWEGEVSLIMRQNRNNRLFRRKREAIQWFAPLWNPLQPSFGTCHYKSTVR